MAANDPYVPDRVELWPTDSSLITSITNVTPASNEVSVQTQSVDTGSVVLYNSDGAELDRVDANSSAWQDTTDVDGETVASVRLGNADASFSTETISVNNDTGGTGGTTETVDVDSTTDAQVATFDGSGSATNNSIMATLMGSVDAQIYVDDSVDSGGHWDQVTQLEDDTGSAIFGANWDTQYNRRHIEANKRRLRVEIDSGATSDGYVAVDGDERGT